MKRKLFGPAMAFMLTLTLAGSAGAMQVVAVNTLREAYIASEAIFSGKIVSITLPSEPRSKTDDYLPYYAVVQCQIKKQYYGTAIQKTVFVDVPLFETDEFVFLPLPFKTNDTLLMFTEIIDGSAAKYRLVDSYKVSSGKLGNLDYLSISDYDKKKLTTILRDLRAVQKQVAKIRVDANKPAKNQLKDIHQLDNMLTYTNGGPAACVKILDTTEVFSLYYSTDNESTTLELEVITPLMGNLPKTFKANSLSGYGFEKGKSYVFFFGENGTIENSAFSFEKYYVFNSWIYQMPYIDGKVVLPHNFSYKSATLEELALLLKACPSHKAS